MTRVNIPGTFIADYDDTSQRITRMIFMPDVSLSGGDFAIAQVWEGNRELDVSSTGGPFWRALQQALEAGEPEIAWAE